MPKTIDMIMRTVRPATRNRVTCTTRLSSGTGVRCLCWVWVNPCLGKHAVRGMLTLSPYVVEGPVAK